MPPTIDTIDNQNTLYEIHSKITNECSNSRLPFFWPSRMADFTDRTFLLEFKVFSIGHQESSEEKEEKKKHLISTSNDLLSKE